VRVFIAGATGAIGSRLTAMLADGRFDVGGMTRHAQRAEQLRRAGITPFVVDVYHQEALTSTLRSFAPDVVIHQLTDLPPNLAPDEMRVGIQRNARIRTEGTRNLVGAALAAGTRRIVAQSIAWAYAPGPEPHTEADSLDLAAVDVRSITIAGVVALETAVLSVPGMQSVVLRYGHLYGPGTGVDSPVNGRLDVHVDAAAQAAFLAIERGSGIYNIAEQDAAVRSEKARRELGWSATYRVGFTP
jgi:nucleoside-diphosphate-sugar epimerase